MAKVWKIIGIAVGIALVLGLLCIGCGLLTGGSTDRIADQFSQYLNFDSLRMSIERFIHEIFGIQVLN